MENKKTLKNEITNLISDLITGNDPQSRPNYISIDEKGGSFVHYPGGTVSVTFDEAERLHKEYPDAMTIKWIEAGGRITPGAKVICFTHD